MATVETAPTTLGYRRRLLARETGWYPVILGLAWILEYFVAAQVSPYAIVRSLAVMTILGSALCLLGTRLFVDGRRGSVFASIILAVILLPASPATVAFAIVSTGALVIERLRHRPDQRWHAVWSRLDRAGHGLAIIALLIVALTAIQSGRLTRIGQDLIDDLPVKAASTLAAPVGGAGPDIYLILLDGYARHDILRTLFETDDQPMIDGLRGRGFEVAEGSRANYLLTPLTLASMLNMSPIDDIPVVRQGRAEGWSEEDTFRLAINRASLFAILRERGYSVVANSPGYEHVAIRAADRFVDAGMLNEAEIILLGYYTALGSWLDTASPGILGKQIRDRIDATFDFAVAEAERATTDGPKLVIAHVPGPHPPLVVDAAGHSTDLGLSAFRSESWPYADPQREASLTRYAGEVAYLGNLVLQSVDRILEASPELPVIVVFSDHGTDVDLDWDHLDPRRLEERSGILFATLTPGQARLFGDEPTPVNTLPTVLNAYLGTSLPTSPDVTFAWNGEFDSPSVPVD